MVGRDAVGRGDLTDRRYLLAMDAKIDQHPQTVVGKSGEAHARARLEIKDVSEVLIMSEIWIIVNMHYTYRFKEPTWTSTLRCPPKNGYAKHYARWTIPRSA